MKRSSINLSCNNCWGVFAAKRYRANSAKYCSRFCQAYAARRPHQPKCRECKVDKPESEFYRNTAMKSGYVSRCKECYERKRKSVLGVKYCTTVSNARKRGLVMSLDKDYFYYVTSFPCFYCGTRELSIGLDRVDNDIGYTHGNIVPCCGPCNSMKSKLSMVDFYDACDTIAKMRSMKKEYIMTFREFNETRPE